MTTSSLGFEMEDEQSWTQASSQPSHGLKMEMSLYSRTTVHMSVPFLLRLSVDHGSLRKYGQKRRPSFNHFLTQKLESPISGYGVSVSALPNGYKTLKTYWSDFLGCLEVITCIVIFLNSIIKYGFIFFYFTPLPPKPSIVMIGGRGRRGPAHLLILKTLTVKVYIPTLFEMIFWNSRYNFENKVERAIWQYLKQLVLLQWTFWKQCL